MPDFEVLDARIASALNRIIHNSHFKRRISLEEQKAQKQDRLLDLRILPGHWSQRFCRELCRPIHNHISLRNDDIQEFDSKWHGISLINGERFHLTTSWKDCTN